VCLLRGTDSIFTHIIQVIFRPREFKTMELSAFSKKIN
jgi:hypothetical protein